MPLFSKTARDYLESGNKHLEQAGDVSHLVPSYSSSNVREMKRQYVKSGLERDLSAEQLRKEMQKAIDDFSKALESVLEKERKEGWHPTYELSWKSPLGNESTWQFKIERRYILTKRAWAYLLDGQFDKSVEDLNAWSDQRWSAGSVAWTVERDLLRARVYALRESYEEALTLYRKVIADSARGKEFQYVHCDAVREKNGLLCKLGRPSEAERSMLDTVPTGATSFWMKYIQDFGERVQKESQEILFPNKPKDRIFLVFLITLKDLNVLPPILRIRKSVALGNSALEVAQRYNLKGELDYMSTLPNIDVFVVPFSAGFILAWRATRGQVSEFIRDMQTRAVIERLDCFAEPSSVS